MDGQRDKLVYWYTNFTSYELNLKETQSHRKKQSALHRTDTELCKQTARLNTNKSEQDTTLGDFYIQEEP